MSQQNVDIVRAAYEAWNSREVDALRELYDPEAIAEVSGDTVAQAQVLMRASDPIFEMGLTFGGHKQEDRFWQLTLTGR